MIRVVSFSTWNICSDLSPWLCRAIAIPALVAAINVGCVHVPPPSHPRPAIPLPASVAARFDLPGAVVEESFVPLGGEDGIAFYRGRLSSGDELAEFYFLAPPDTGPRPFVLCLPILAGGEQLMWLIAMDMAHRGYAVAWSKRVTSALKPPQRGHELELLLRRTVVHNRMLLDWARRQDNVEPERMGCIGVSLGAIVATLMLAVESDLRAGALCLAGGDLPDLLINSAENRVARWRRWRRRTDGVAGSELARELRRFVLSDPARIGPYIPTHKVLMVGGSFDEVVPRRNQEVLWESLGRPERRALPLGHYTAFLAFSSILDSVAGFLDARLRS